MSVIKHLDATVCFHTSEHMKEVKDKSVKLITTSPPYLGKKAVMVDYIKLYQRVLVEEAVRVLRDDGYLVVIVTDPYKDAGVFPRNHYMAHQVLESGHFKLLDRKVWKRKQGDLFLLSFSDGWVFGRPGAKRPKPKPNPEYFPGVWEFHVTKGGELNSWPDTLCKRLVNAFTAPGDVVVDPFAGTCRLLHVCNTMQRKSFGYEIDRKGLENGILANLHATPTVEVLKQEGGLLGGNSIKKK